MKTLEEKFYQKFEPVTESGCWIWMGYTSGRKYGCLHHEGKYHRAHRFSYELHIGPIPKGMCVLHKCDVPLCVNPHHLFLGTQEDNMKDMVLKDRAHQHQGTDNGRAKLTEQDVRKIRELYRTSRVSLSQLGRDYNVTHTTIRNIIHNKLWTHI